jgi:hypothetical protein
MDKLRVILHKFGNCRPGLHKLVFDNEQLHNDAGCKGGDPHRCRPGFHPPCRLE